MKTNLTRRIKKPLLFPRIAVVKTMLILTFLMSFHTITRACGGSDTLYIRHDTTWSAVPAAFHGQNILIEDGVTFTILGITLEFGSACGIENKDSPVVGAHLIIEGSYLYGCGGLSYDASWQGITMTGVSDSGGYLGAHYTEYLAPHGTITGINHAQTSVVIGGVTMRDARCGIFCINHAIIQVNTSIFDNCATGISIQDSSDDYNYTYILIDSYWGVVPCVSYIENSTFNAQTPVSGLTSYLSDYKCIRLYNTQYLEIMGNTFECTGGATGASGRATGIYAIDANFACHSTTGASDPLDGCISYTYGSKVSNKFIGLSYGIYSTDYMVFWYTIGLDDNQFTECYTALYIYGGLHHTFHGNSFKFTDDATYWTGTIGTSNKLVDLETAGNFIFYGNKLTENRNNTTFLYINASGTDQKNITLDTFINTYSSAYSSGDQEYGIYFSGDNRDQIVTCNYFSNHNYCIYANASSQLSDFGCSSCGIGHASEGCGNLFSPYTPDPLITNTNWYVYNANTSYTLNYYEWTIITSHVNYPAPTGGVNDLSASVDNCSTISTCSKWSLGINTFPDPVLGVKVYPNPASDKVVFDFSGMKNAKGAMLNICDIQGRHLGIFGTENGLPEIEINTSKYANGIYIYKMILDGNMQKTGKFEVKH